MEKKPREIKINGSCGTTFDVVAPIELPTAIKKQTAVELLEQQLKERYSLMNSEPLFEQAKQMEKEQIIDAYLAGEARDEKYFNETYGGQDEQ